MRHDPDCDKQIYPLYLTHSKLLRVVQWLVTIGFKIMDSTENSLGWVMEGANILITSNWHLFQRKINQDIQKLVQTFYKDQPSNQIKKNLTH